MSKPLKIYDTDPEVYGHSSEIAPDRTKGEIDGILARFGIRDVWWRYDIAHNDVFVKFILSEKFGEKEKNLTVQLEPPRIYHKGKSGDTLNWKASMRNLYWYIYTHLSQAYVNQSSNFQEFLPNILSRDGKKVSELMQEQYKALPEFIQEEVTEEREKKWTDDLND